MRKVRAKKASSGFLSFIQGAVCSVVCMCIIACGGDSKKEDKDLLKVFENKSSLVDETEIEKELQLFKPSEENHSEDTSGAEDAEDIKEKEEPVPSDSVHENKKQEITQERVTIGAFTSVPVSKNRIISISSDKEGDIFLAEEKRILKLSKKSSGQEIREILSPSIYELDTGEVLPPISHISLVNGTVLWVGFSNGQIAYRPQLEWKALAGGPQFSNAQITTIEEGFGSPFIGGNGLYQWDAAFNRFLTIGDAKGLSIKNIAKTDTSLLVSSNYNLYQIPFPEKSFTEHFKPFREDVPLGEVSTYGNNIFLGTKQGVLMLSKQGYPLKRFAEDISVQKIFPIDDSKGIILSRSGSLIAYLGRKTFSTKERITHTIADAHLDNSGTLWIAQKVPLVYQGNLVSVYKWIIKQSRGETQDESFVKNYTKACDAYDDLIKGSNFSGHISRAVIDGRTYIFAKGVLVCPSGIGTIRPDGLTLLLNGWELSIHKRNSREIIKIPEQIPVDQTTKIFLDSKERIFLATKHGLFFREEDEKWEFPEKKELKEDFISDITEDSKGNIWIASRIQNPRGETETPKEYQPLHILTTRGWAHFGTGEGLNSFGIAEIEADEEEILLASSRGFTRISPSAEVLTQGPREGFTRSIIENITKDHYNRIWMGHGYFLPGISWIKGNNLYITTKEKGLFSDRINMIGIDGNDRIWIIDTGGRTGVYSYNELLKISERRQYQKHRTRKGKLLQ